MRGPNLIKLIRSLRTKSYEKLQIQKHLSSITSREKGADRDISPEQKSSDRKESHGEIESD